MEKDWGQTCCQADCGDMLGREPSEGKQKETEGSVFFMSEPAGLPARAKRKHEQLFLTKVKLTNDPDFPIPCDFVPYAPGCYCLALTWGRKTPHSLCFGALGLTSSCKAEASPANLLTCNFKCIQRRLSERGTALYPGKKKHTQSEKTCQDQ